MLHIRSNWLGPIFLSPGRSHTKGLIAQLHPGLEVSLRLTLIQKRDLCPPRLFSLTTEFSVFMPLQGITPGSSWLEGVSLKDYKIISKISVREMKTNLYLETLNITMDKMDRGGGNKTKRLYRCCSKGPGYTGSTLI